MIDAGQMYLFDPVLASPVPADAKGKGIATLAAVQQKPELLELLGIAAKDAKEFFHKSEIVLNCPLSGYWLHGSNCSKRILENNLLEAERCVLFVDAAKACAQRRRDCRGEATEGQGRNRHRQGQG